MLIDANNDAAELLGEPDDRVFGDARNGRVGGQAVAVRNDLSVGRLDCSAGGVGYIQRKALDSSASLEQIGEEHGVRVHGAFQNRAVRELN